MNTGGRARLCEEFSPQLGTNAHTSEKNSSFFNDRLVVFSMVIFVFVECRSVGSHRHHCHSHFVVKKQRAKTGGQRSTCKSCKSYLKTSNRWLVRPQSNLTIPPGEILGGGVPPGSPCQILTLFQTKKCHFPHLFPDQTCKIHTRFQTWSLGGNVVIIT